MNIGLFQFHFQTSIRPNGLSHHLFTLKCSYSNKSKLPKTPKLSQTTIPARDRVIDFGKNKGKLLGSLPSSYLKWVSKNLRARDFEDWAKLADQVLQDPLYQDRIEWEFAQNVLNGDSLSSFSSGNGRMVSDELMEISERFGWDNEDKIGWSRVDFELLGTSKSGRIPRLGKTGRTSGQKIMEAEKRTEEEEEGTWGRRKERRERIRKRLKSEEVKDKGNLVNVGRNDVKFQRERDEIYNPFPGREALLKKVLQRRKRFL